MRHSGKSVEDRKTIECPYETCEKKFTTKSNLAAHVRSAHEGLRYVCGEFTLAGPEFEGWSTAQGCGDKFVTKATLEEHVRFLHLGYERTKLSRPAVIHTAETLIDDISGVTNQAKHNIPCPHCTETFIRYSDLSLHLDSTHGGDVHSGLALLHSEPQPGPMFGHDDALGSGWPADEVEEEIFAVQMNYSPPEDDWLQDEANILLLAREDHQMDQIVDPTLSNM
jgi:general transcription factor IIIA